MKSRLLNRKAGQAMIVATLFFIFISLTIVIGISGPVSRRITVSQNLARSRGALFLAEAGTEDAVYRMKNGFGASNGDTITLNGETATLSVSDVSGGKNLLVEGDFNEYVKKVETKLMMGQGVAFNYGVQSGNGGFSLGGGSVIWGNVYSNGNITGLGAPLIKGSAVAANSIPLTADQTNGVSGTPGSQIVFGNANSSQDSAQSFSVLESAPLKSAELYIKRTATTPANITVKIVNDNGSNKPGTYLITSGTLSATSVGQTYGWVPVAFTTNPNSQLTPGVKYWMVLDTSTGSASKNYTWAANNTYLWGQARIYSTGSGGSWNETSPAGLDGYFKIYVGGNTSTIAGDGSAYLRIGETSADNAWAHTVKSTDTEGSIFCSDIAGSTQNNGKSCTPKADPPSVAMPISDSSIAQWKEDAFATGAVTTGNLSVNSTGTTTGPRKITGNLTVSGGGTLILTGTLWVQGNVIVSGGGNIKLASSYGSDGGVIVTDGYVSISGDGLFEGSGQVGSYPLIVTTSDCPVSAYCSGNSAITLTGGSGAVILNAQKGTVTVNGDSGAKSLAGYKVVVSGGGEVHYEDGMADLNFSSGPSGGWNLTSWKEIDD